MYFKAGLLAVAAGAVMATAEPTGQNQINIHRQFKINDEICVTKQPITACQAGFTPVYDQENQRSVEMYCLEQSHPMAHQMAQTMETGHRLRNLQQEARKQTKQVPKVIRCKTTGLTKNGEIEDNTQVFAQQQNGKQSYQPRKQFQSKQEREQQYETVRSEQKEKLHQLQKLVPTIEKAIQLSQSEYEQAYEQIKSIAHKDQQVDGILYMLQSQLPAAYVQAVHRVQDELTTDNMSEEEQKKVHEQLKNLASRVYIYTLARLHQQEQKQPIREQIEQYQNWEQTQNWEQFEEQFQRVWNQIKREIEEDRQGEKIIKAVERQFERKFQRQITEEQKEQLQPWQLTLQKEQKSWEQKQQQQQQQQSQPQQVEQQMTRQQREKQQQQLTKIVMASLLKAERMQKDSQKQQSGFAGLFNKHVSYEKLAKQVNNQFETEY